MNILLVVPRYEIYGGMHGHYVMPLGILYVSAYLKRHGVCKVHTLNMNHHEGSEEEVLGKALDEGNIDFMGIGGLSGEYTDVARIVRLARRLRPDMWIQIGGGLVTADPESTMRALPEADFGVIGEGEITMVELIDALTCGTSLEDVDGLIFPRPDGTYCTTHPRAEIQDLDSLPFPDYEGFNYDEYLRKNPDMSDEGKKYSQVSVIGGRSCKYNCTFCFHPSGSRYRQRSLDSIFAEIDYLVAHYEISYIALREELFTVDNDRVRNFCRRVGKYDFDWSIQMRIDNVDPELVAILSGTRCRYIFLGVESADDRILKSMRKGITRAKIEQALELLNEAGLTVRSGVIMGDSLETVETAKITLDWHQKNSRKYSLYCDMIIAFPGSILYQRARRAGIIPDPVQFLKDGCPIVNLTKMSDDEFLALVSEVEKRSGRKYKVKFYHQKTE